MTEFQVVRVAGSPYERGLEYGRQARDLIQELARGVLPEQLRSRTGLAGEEIAAAALAYDQPISDFSPEIHSELRGLAAGAGLEWHELLMINAYKEIERTSPIADAEPPQDCTSVALSPQRTEADHLVAQNIDMHWAYRDLGIILELTSSSGVRMLTWTVAGTLGQTGINSLGLGRAGNGVHAPGWRRGVPSAVLTRKLLEQSTVAEVQELCSATERASSVNYMVADASGYIADLELTVTETFALHPGSGRLVHTNHFCSPAPAAHGTYPRIEGSLLRFDRMTELVGDSSKLMPSDLMRFLSDHQSAPDSICAHEHERQTVASCVLEPAAGRIHISKGIPCESPYQTLALT